MADDGLKKIEMEADNLLIDLDNQFALNWVNALECSSIGTDYGVYVPVSNQFIEFQGDKAKLAVFIRDQLCPIIRSLAPADSTWQNIDLKGYGNTTGIKATGKPCERIPMGAESWNTWNADIVCGILLESDTDKNKWRLRFAFCPFEKLADWFCDKISQKTKAQYNDIKVLTSEEIRQLQLAQEKKEKEEQRQKWESAGLCTNCGGSLKSGLFGTKCTVCKMKI